jgi:hypothetical protein
MSLLNTASTWVPTNDTKKRTPSIGKRKTQRQKPRELEEEPNEELSESMQSTIEQNAERGKTVYDMLNKITSSDAAEDLADFKPIAPPIARHTNAEGFEGVTEEPSSYDNGFEHLSSYAKSYEASGILGKPYYATGKGSSGASGDPVMQKLNHITHILEELQMEKTSNITEELILYTFLGVFVIFVVDSFARVGKYHR